MNPEHKQQLDRLVDLMTAISDLRRDQLVARTTNARTRPYRNALFWIAHNDYGISVRDIAAYFGVAPRTVVHAKTEIARNVTMTNLVSLMRVRLAHAALKLE